jgi:hypothetical protein
MKTRLRTEHALVRLLLGFLALVVANPAFARGQIQSTVRSIRTDVSDFPGSVLVQFYSAVSGSACPSGGYSDSMGFDATTPAGKNALAILTAAFLSAKSVIAVGNGTCGAYGQPSLEYLAMAVLLAS